MYVCHGAFNMANTTVAPTTPAYMSQEEMKAVAVVSMLTSGLSLFGSGSILICGIYHRRVCAPEIFPIFHLSVANALASLFMVVVTSLVLDGNLSYPGSSGPCGYLLAIMMSLYISTFFLTLGYALEAFIRLHRRLQSYLSLEGIRTDGVSNTYMYAVYFFSWFIPIALAIFLMVTTRLIKDPAAGSIFRIMPPECSLCYPAFAAQDQFCWNHVTKGHDWHMMYRLIFLVPLLLVFILNMVLYICIGRDFRQVSMRRGLLSYHQRQEEAMLRKKAFMYQMAFIVCWIPTLALQVLSFSESFSMAAYYWLFLLQALLGPLQGLLNCTIYGWKRDSFRRALTESTHLLNASRGTGMSFTL